MNTKKILQKVLIVLVSIVLLLSSYSKFSAQPVVIDILTALNLSPYRIGLGFIELIILVCLWNRNTRTIGVLVGSAYLGGVIVSEFSLGMSGLIPGAFLVAVWTIHRLDMWINCGCGICKKCTRNTLQHHDTTPSLDIVHTDTVHTQEKCNCRPGCVCYKESCNC